MRIYKTIYHAPKPESIERYKAYIVGGGIAGLVAAAFLNVREFVMKRATLFMIPLVFVLAACNTSGAPGQQITPEAALKTAIAIAPTLQAAAPTLESVAQVLQPIIASAKPDENGIMHVTITDDQFNLVLLASQALLTDSKSPIANPVVTFTGGTIVLEGDITQPVSGHLVVVFRPYMNNGVLQLEVVKATIGNQEAPKSALVAAEELVNQSLSQVISQLPENATLQDVSVGEGTLTITVKVN